MLSIVNEEKDRYYDKVRAVYKDGVRIGYAKWERREQKWQAFNWNGNVVYALVKNPRWEGQRDSYTVDTFIEAKKQILDEFERNHDDYLMWREKCKAEEEEKQRHSGASVMKLLTDGNDSFYPTPEALAGKMCGKIRTDWKKIQSVLEPSAGKGNLVDALNRFLSVKYHDDGYRRDENHYHKFDTLEIDINLQCLLKGKGLRVIGDDFLHFTSTKAYDLILMNPDFANGDAHLLKAIQLQERFGGEIVCLLNAETIRNPYTNSRKLLKQKLAEYNASIEFVEHAFMKAERKTDVEVAIVQLMIPSRFKSRNILEGFEKAKARIVEEKEQLGIRPVGDFVYDLITDYNLEAEAGYKIISEFAAISSILNNRDDYHKLLKIEICDKDMTAVSPSAAYNDFLTGLRMRYWKRLFERDELRRKMTSKMSDEYTSKLSEMRDYEFNEFNIHNLMFELQNQLLGGVEESILTLFDKFSAQFSYYPECQNNIHYYNGWATNKAHFVNPTKVIIPMNGFQTHYNWEKTWSLSEWSILHDIGDLERSLRYLDKGEIDYYVRAEDSVSRAQALGDYRNIEFTYFYVTFYKKGTAHIKFKPETKSLIDRLNIFAAQKRSWLPPRYGKVHYEDMTPEEQEVIADFQGSIEYEKVVNEPEKYLLTADNLSQHLLTA